MPVLPGTPPRSEEGREKGCPDPADAGDASEEINSDGFLKGDSRMGLNDADGRSVDGLGGRGSGIGGTMKGHDEDVAGDRTEEMEGTGEGATAPRLEDERGTEGGAVEARIGVGERRVEDGPGCTGRTCSSAAGTVPEAASGTYPADDVPENCVKICSLKEEVEQVCSVQQKSFYHQTNLTETNARACLTTKPAPPPVSLLPFTPPPMCSGG